MRRFNLWCLVFAVTSLIGLSAPAEARDAICGSANGTYRTSAPTADLCSSGDPSDVRGKGPWVWRCNGGDRKTSVRCSAQLQTQGNSQANGACGASNGARASARCSTTPTRSISEWATCGGAVDSARGVAAAFAAARNNAFTLQVDFPVFIHIGEDYTRPIFVDNGTTVNFTSGGKFIVDNLFVPALVIVNSSNIAFTNWNVQYSNRMTIDSAGMHWASMFNDVTTVRWMRMNRGVVYDQSQGRVSSYNGSQRTLTMFFFTGSASNISILGLKLYVDRNVGGEGFVPYVFGFNVGERDNTIIKSSTAATPATHAVPSNITFSDIDLDGTVMGWQGTVQNATFTHIRSHRYSDLQDAGGGNVGGIGHWFAPPHLFYLVFDTNGDINLINRNITLKDVIDYGDRVGVARDSGVKASLGNALSLKIGGENVVIDGYQSYRPDGFMDVLASNGLTLQNVIATYNSDFLHRLYRGIRFPGPFGAIASGYININFHNISLTDLAPSTNMLPVGTCTGSTTGGLIFDNVHLYLNQWRDADLTALFGSAINYWGAGNKIVFDYHVPAPVTSAPISIVAGRDETMTYTLNPQELLPTTFCDSLSL
jgi:hypothetical protein